MAATVAQAMWARGLQRRSAVWLRTCWSPVTLKIIGPRPTCQLRSLDDRRVEVYRAGATADGSW